MRQPAPEPPGAEAGFTLVELVVTMMLISIAALGVTYALSFGLSRQSDGLWRSKSVALAEAYLEEITARRYDEATPLGGVPPCSPVTAPCSALGRDGENRANFDDVDDFDGLDEQPPVDALGKPLARYSGYRVQVSVAYMDARQVSAFGLDDPTDGKLVTVIVTAPGQSPMRFPVLRTNY